MTVRQVCWAVGGLLFPTLIAVVIAMTAPGDKGRILMEVGGMLIPTLFIALIVLASPSEGKGERGRRLGKYGRLLISVTVILMVAFGTISHAVAWWMQSASPSNVNTTVLPLLGLLTLFLSPFFAGMLMSQSAD